MKKIILSLMIILVIFVTTGCGNKASNKIEKFEINEELKVSSLVSENKSYEILNKDEKIDASKLGEKEVVIKYKENGVEKQQTIKINIVDTTKPKIECKNELNTTEGTKIDLLKDVKVSDNSKEKIKATVEGKYDINKVGTYKLKYVALDSSNNKVEKEFTLKVNKKVVNSVKFENLTLYFGKYKMEGDIPEGYTGTITINQDGTATSTGYYYNSKGNFEKKDLTGKWSVEENSIAGLQGDPKDLSNNKVNGIYFSWDNGEKSAFGLGTKYFGDQFHGYRWYSY